MKNTLLNDFCQLYQSLNKDNLERLKEVYSDSVVFIDPIHQVNGLDALTTYFANLYENMDYCHFHINRVIEQPGEASIIWRMEYAHHKIKKGQRIVVDGSSHLQFSEKIDCHRDYLDLGQMLYEHLPMIGPVIKAVKKRAS
ncbi:transcriptional regulator [Psychromonas sp. psych-6C06]|uniref:nuclear transport factor 2 family protein n=1 Tax=Psychromonas sp. psych-6C06 TaxID=2058089 RepID=UPI000C31D621|nr:nuclear transport factor 2 family protein [Psychromonas sp. psych-6C06]PKF63859.1 transcriptional regulator [Psychromonas sp. psych-6C06]